MFLRNRMKKLRKQSGLSLESMAVDIFVKTKYRVTRQALENWEKGRNNPSVDGLLVLCEYYQKPLGFFFAHKTTLHGVGCADDLLTGDR